MARAAIRRACAPDAGAIARVSVETWRDAYRGLLPAPVLRDLSVLRRTRLWWTALCEQPLGAVDYVAEDSADGVVGFLSGGTEREDARRPRRGEVYALYVLPAHQRRRLGKALVSVACDELLRRGHTSLVVWMLDGNPSRAFYESLGGMPGSSRFRPLCGHPVREVSYEWPDLRRVAAVARAALRR